MTKRVFNKNPNKGKMDGSKVYPFSIRAMTIHSKIKNNNFNSVTFIKKTGEKVIQNINDLFLKDYNGRRKTGLQIESDLKAIAHDLKAVDFIV